MSTFVCCINCKDRNIGCHSKCEKYIKQKEVLEKNKKDFISNTRPVISNNDFLGMYYFKIKK